VWVQPAVRPIVLAINKTAAIGTPSFEDAKRR
jgi:hypothetical protein